jgi:hypothetical protein
MSLIIVIITPQQFQTDVEPLLVIEFFKAALSCHNVDLFLFQVRLTGQNMVVLIASFFEAHLSIFGLLAVSLIRNHTYLFKLLFVGSCNLVCHLELQLLFGVGQTVFAQEFLVEGHKMLCFGNISKLGKSIGYK